MLEKKGKNQDVAPGSPWERIPCGKPGGGRGERKKRTMNVFKKQGGKGKKFKKKNFGGRKNGALNKNLLRRRKRRNLTAKIPTRRNWYRMQRPRRQRGQSPDKEGWPGLRKVQLESQKAAPRGK